MLDQVVKFPDMIIEAMNSFKNLRLPLYRFENIVICGAGASANVGDLLKDVLKYDYDKPMEISTDYALPGFVNGKTLAIVISYSGNTEETLKQFVELRKRTNKIIAVSSGGKLEHWSKRWNVPHVKIPTGFQPRMSAPYMFVPLIMFFGKLIGRNFNEDIYEGYREIRSIDVKHIERMAGRLLGKEIAVYGTNEFAGVVKRWKNELNENAKVPVMWHILPEMNHNEIVGYQNTELNRNRVVIFFRDRDETPEQRARIDITERLIVPNVASVEEVWAKGKSKVAKIISLIFGAAYTSVFLAKLQGIDAERTEFIGVLKAELDDRLSTVMKLEIGEKGLN